MGSRILLVCLLAVAGSACVHVHDHARRPAAVVVKAPGPPPHAPAHGYRHKQHTQNGAVELVFDSKLSLYVVVGWPGYYFHSGSFYRQIDGRWHVSARLHSGWVTAAPKKLPPGLAKRGGKKGRHPAKHGY